MVQYVKLLLQSEKKLVWLNSAIRSESLPESENSSLLDMLPVLSVPEDFCEDARDFRSCTTTWE